jgi:4-carboxymuconolactone decarboxylase
VTEAEAVLVRISGALAARDWGRVDGALEGALQLPGVDRVAVEEALLQSYLFLGYPAALEGLGRWRTRLGGVREEAGQEPPRSGDPWSQWGERGEEVCARVYGDQYPRLCANIRSLHPDMESWMVTEGYGKVLGRPGLSLRMRELCIVAILAVIEAPRQLYSHLRGALRVGASVEEVTRTLELVAEGQPEGGRDLARAVWDDVRSRSVPPAVGGPVGG